MASNKKKLSCTISIDDPVSSESESELDDDDLLDFDLTFPTGRLTLADGVDSNGSSGSGDERRNGAVPKLKLEGTRGLLQ